MVSLFNDSTSQTDNIDKHVLPVTEIESIGIQCSPVINSIGSQSDTVQGTNDVCVQTFVTEKMAAESQTTYNGRDASMQTFGPMTTEVGLQIELKYGSDCYSQTDINEFINTCTQTVRVDSEECSVQTTPTIVSDIGLQIVLNNIGTDEYSQTAILEFVNNSSQTESQPVVVSGILVDDCSQIALAESGSQTIMIESLDNCVQTMSMEVFNTSSQTPTVPGQDRFVQTELNDSTSTIGLQTHILGINNTTQTVLPSCQTTSSQTNQDQLSSPFIHSASALSENSELEESTVTIIGPQMSDSSFWPVNPTTTGSSFIETHSDVMETEPHTSPTNSMTDLEGQVVALKAAVSGLKTQLVLERESHKRQLIGLEREMKQVQRSIGRDTEVCYNNAV